MLDELHEERKALAEDVDSDTQVSTVNEDAEKAVEDYAEDHGVYRETNGLKDVIKRYNGNDAEVRRYEDNGRRMLGANTGKMKRIFISDSAPKLTRLQRSGNETRD